MWRSLLRRAVFVLFPAPFGSPSSLQTPSSMVFYISVCKTVNTSTGCTNVWFSASREEGWRVRERQLHEILHILKVEYFFTVIHPSPNPRPPTPSPRHRRHHHHRPHDVCEVHFLPFNSHFVSILFATFWIFTLPVHFISFFLNYFFETGNSGRWHVRRDINWNQQLKK